MNYVCISEHLLGVWAVGSWYPMNCGQVQLELPEFRGVPVRHLFSNSRSVGV